MSEALPAVCAVCRATRWQVTFEGNIRDGAWGSFKPGTVMRCTSCGVERLDEANCLEDAAYAGTAYRDLLQQASDLDAQHRLHDSVQGHNLALVMAHGLRGKRVLDVGGGAGTFLGYVRGVARSVTLVEPMPGFREAVSGQGIQTYASVDGAVSAGNLFDIVTCFQVIEHVQDPRALLESMQRLVAPSGVLIVTTPNRNDVLMSLVPEFRSFFFRTVHRWYFDADSLRRLAETAGLENASVRSLHRQSMANAFGWMLERRPVGSAKLESLDVAADLFWKGYLEQRGSADTLVLEVIRPGESPA